jgi:hypothetical protein
MSMSLTSGTCDSGTAAFCCSLNLSIDDVSVVLHCMMN